MLKLPYVETLHGDRLKARMQTAGFKNVTVAVVGENIEISGQGPSGEDIGEDHRGAVESMLTAANDESIQRAKSNAARRTTMAQVTEKVKSGLPLTATERNAFDRFLLGILDE